MDLKGSRWASASKYSSRPLYQQPRQSPSRPPISLSEEPSLKRAPEQIATDQAKAERAAEFARHRRLLRRLRWKLPGLATSHRLATALDSVHPHYAEAQNEVDLKAAQTEAELMFKLDWFEYYALLEKALLHLLGVWGIRVRRHGLAADAVSGNEESEQQEKSQEADSIIGARVHASPYGHRFHANVLASLDMVQNPLHEVLGSGEVRRQLGSAKRLRNLWKDADEQASNQQETEPLASYDIEHMLRSIFAGFEAAYELAERAVEHDSHVAMDIEVDDSLSREKGKGKNKEYNDTDGDLIMGDAMDWED